MTNKSFKNPLTSTKRFKFSLLSCSPNKMIDFIDSHVLFIPSSSYSNSVRFNLGTKDLTSVAKLMLGVLQEIVRAMVSSSRRGSCRDLKCMSISYARIWREAFALQPTKQSRVFWSGISCNQYIPRDDIPDKKLIKNFFSFCEYQIWHTCLSNTTFFSNNP